MKYLIPVVALALIGATPAMAGHHEGSMDGEKPHAKKGMMFKNIDTDSDGNITREEFMNHAEKRFNKMDKDDDGMLTREEARKAHTKKDMKHKKEMMEEKADDMHMHDSE